MQSASAAGHSAAAVSHGRPGKPPRAAAKDFERQVRDQVKHNATISHAAATVTGPHMWDPSLNGGKGGPNPNASTVTVNQTSDMVNQQVQVSWTNFTPSSALIYNASNTYYPVMAAECDSASPASPADCYAAEVGGVSSVSGPDGPDNTSYGTTAPDGSGLVDIHILTGVDNPFLGCSQSHKCSLVIVPAQGGNIAKIPADCADHSGDAGFGGTALGNIDFGSNSNDYLCSWSQRIVIPLTFAPTPKDCKLRNPLFNVAGSPMLGRAMQSWDTALCLGSHGFNINYTPSVAEPQALQELAGGTDVALTTRTAAAQGLSTGTKHYLYAPVAVSAVSVTYWFDNPLTGLPETGVQLDQRLLLKLLTQSYAFENDGCPITVNPPPPLGCDNGVDHNPQNLFVDPEFTQLNPNILEPVNGPIEIPTVISGQTDTTWDVTSWIAANKDAAAFLKGQYDPWGMHLNTAYNGLGYPYNDFVGQDSFPIVQQEYNPVFPLTAVASDMVENWPPGFSVTKDQFGNYPRLPPQPVGERALVTLLDQADSAAYLFPDAAIPNATGTYTEPTTSAMEAALKGMTKAGDGTKQPNLASTDKAAYPLTMVVYAVVPTSGTAHAKAVGIAKFLDYVAGSGQHPGVLPGQLPPGYAPLPASLAAQTRKDAIAVRNQTGATPSKNTNPGSGSASPGSTPTPSATGTPGSVALPAVGPSSAIPGISLVSDAKGGRPRSPGTSSRRC